MLPEITNTKAALILPSHRCGYVQTQMPHKYLKEESLPPDPLLNRGMTLVSPYHVINRLNVNAMQLLIKPVLPKSLMQMAQNGGISVETLYVQSLVR